MSAIESLQRRKMSLRRQLGLSLIELMVALAISAILTLGLVQVFSASRMTFNANSALARTQENSRFAMDFLKYDLRMLSHMGCQGELGYNESFFNHLSATTPKAAPYAYRFDMPVQVYEAAGTAPGQTYNLPATPLVGDASAWSPALPAALGIQGSALAGSDVIVVRYLSADYVSLTGFGILANATGDMTVAPADVGYVEDGGVYAVTNCGIISMFQAVSGGGTTTIRTVGGDNQVGWRATEGFSLNSAGFSAAVAGKGNESDYGPALLLRYNLAAYYVAEGADGRPALFRKELDTDAANNIGDAQEVAPGVESIQAVLGVTQAVPRVDDQPTVYLTANAIQNGTWRGDAASPELRWRDVVSMRVGMLMTSTNPVSVPASPIKVVADTKFSPPDDQRQRQVYETHINVRNRSRG